MTVSKKKDYQCQIDILFPTATQALHAKEVLEVDGEIGDQIMKTFQVIANDARNTEDIVRNGELKVLSV